MGYFIGGLVTGILGVIIIEAGLLLYIKYVEDDEPNNEEDEDYEEDNYNDW